MIRRTSSIWTPSSRTVRKSTIFRAGLDVLFITNEKKNYIDPGTLISAQVEERQPVVLKEVKLPHATETHEVCYEPLSRCVFVSQMSSSTLVRIPVSASDGLLVDDQDAFWAARGFLEGRLPPSRRPPRPAA